MKKLIPLMLVGAATVAFGQNARVEAMAGVTTQGDMSDGFYNTAYLIPYLNSGQMTADHNGDFDFIATKTFGDILFIGASLSDDGNVITVQDETGLDIHNFFTDAKALHNGSSTGSMINQDEFNPIPNLIVGADISSSLAVGAEIYYDVNRVNQESEDVDGDETIEESITNKGVIVSALIGDEYQLAPRLGIGLPRNNLTIENSNSGVTTTDTYETKSAVAITAGADLLWPVNNVDMLASVGWSMEKYQLTQKIADTETDGNTKVANNFSVLYGVTGTLNDDLLWVAEYRGDYLIGREKQKTDGDNKSTTDYSSMQNEFALAFERPVDGFWIFDGLTPRAGFQYTGGKGYDKDVSKTGGEDSNENISRNYSYGVDLTTGFGLEKGRATIDLALEFGDWEGAISGPSAGSATLTVDFGKDSATSSPSTPASNSGVGNW